MLDTLIQLHQSLLDLNRVPFVIGAILTTYCIGLVTGAYAGNANPAVWGFYSFFVGKIGDRMDNIGRSSQDLIFRGFILTVFCILFSYLLSKIILGFSQEYPWVEFIFLCACMTSGSVWYLLLALYFSLEKKYEHPRLYYSLARSTRTDFNSIDNYGHIREAIAYLAYTFDRGVVAPSFWYLVGGLPLVLVYATLAGLSWRFGKCGFTKGFGAIPNELEKIAGFAPSLFTAFLFIAAAAITPSVSVFSLLSQWIKGAGQVPYFQGGFAVSALSHAMGVTLGGAVQDITGSSLQKVWTGDEKATVKLDYRHIKRALFMLFTAKLLYIMVLAGLFLLKERQFI